MFTLSCPQCALPVTVIDRFILCNTTGEPVEHVRIACPAPHHFLMALDRLTETAPVAEAALAAMVAARAR